MYIYDMPYEICNDLCRILDHDDDWKDLADRMAYTAFDVLEMEQVALREGSSPTKQLLTHWGQLNHRVGQLFILLYRIQHIPALKCLMPITDGDYHKLYKKLCLNSITHKDTTIVEDTNKNQKLHTDVRGIEIPIPVKLIEQGIPLPTSSRGFDVSGTATEDDSNQLSAASADEENDIRSEIMRNVAAIPMLKYDELKEATNNWSNANMLGYGGFADVFKGEWKQLTVAVKRLRANKALNRNLIRELCLNQYRHDNIVPLYGYSYGGAEVCLVYQLMPAGSLELRLRGDVATPLTWPQRYRIAHGVARGLQFLHTMSGTPLIHGDIKPGNILLDYCLMPKIGDFGLARKGPHGDDESHIKVERVLGTRSYLPEEYIWSGCLSPAVDVFSFGVVMLEVATCLKAIDVKRPVPRLPDHIRLHAERPADTAVLEDQRLINTPNSNPTLCREFINIGIGCTMHRREGRPSMLDVYKRLDSLAQNKPSA